MHYRSEESCASHLEGFGDLGEVVCVFGSYSEMKKTAFYGRTQWFDLEVVLPRYVGIEDCAADVSVRSTGIDLEIDHLVDCGLGKEDVNGVSEPGVLQTRFENVFSQSRHLRRTSTASFFGSASVDGSTLQEPHRGHLTAPSLTNCSIYVD